MTKSTACKKERWFRQTAAAWAAAAVAAASAWFAWQANTEAVRPNTQAGAVAQAETFLKLRDRYYEMEEKSSGYS